MNRQDAVANNIANANTNGYKRDITLARTFPDMLISKIGDVEQKVNGGKKVIPPKEVGRLGTGACLDEVFTDFTSGIMQKTDNPLDLALAGEGYFVVETPQGERFTRGGNFKINQEGILCNQQGFPVLDSNDQEIYIRTGMVSIDSYGDIMDGNEYIARLKIAFFEDNSILEKQGDVFFNPRQEVNYELLLQPQIMQGFLEGSNVNIVHEMVQMISITRAYELSQKVVQAQDETLQAAIEQVGRTS